MSPSPPTPLTADAPPPAHGRPESGFAPVVSPDSEATLNGNQVVLEDQMMKMNESRMDYDAAVGFYQKSLGLIQLAIRKPGS